MNNRRGFLATLIGAAVAGALPKPPKATWGIHAIDGQILLPVYTSAGALTSKFAIFLTNGTDIYGYQFDGNYLSDRGFIREFANTLRDLSPESLSELVESVTPWSKVA